MGKKASGGKKNKESSQVTGERGLLFYYMCLFGFPLPAVFGLKVMLQPGKTIP